MPTRIGVIHRIIITVRIKIKSVRIFGINILGTIRRDKSTPFRVVVTRVEVVELRLLVIVVTSITNGVYVSNSVVGSRALDGAVTRGCLVDYIIVIFKRFFKCISLRAL